MSNSHTSRGWVGVDLDGTLAYYDKWTGIDSIGDPIPKMVEVVKKLLAQNIEIRIFTARISPVAIALSASTPDLVAAREAVARPIREWCVKHFDQEFAITCEKDLQMLTAYDDRCHQVLANTGKTMLELVAEEQARRLSFEKFFLDIAAVYGFTPGQTLEESMKSFIEQATEDRLKSTIP